MTLRRETTISSVRNQTRGTVVATSIKAARRPLARMRGLLGRNHLEAGCGLWITPCTMVHTFFMRFPIDVIFISPEQMVVGLIRVMKPFRVSGLHLQAAGALELKAGSIDRSSTRLDDRLIFDYSGQDE